MNILFHMFVTRSCRFIYLIGRFSLPRHVCGPSYHCILASSGLAILPNLICLLKQIVQIAKCTVMWTLQVSRFKGSLSFSFTHSEWSTIFQEEEAFFRIDFLNLSTIHVWGQIIFVVRAIMSRIMVFYRCSCPKTWNLWTITLYGKEKLNLQIKLRLLISGT